ncbi:hypothetical protein SNE40_023187 [Patella caerulea]|uniref:Uncharacterized protein n=1 Tax=Patella caerulea TaxID=87958 RepID=A0AAN8G9N4_PATCE
MLTLSALLVLCAASCVFCGPFHASCSVVWNSNGNCDYFHTKIVNQIKAWNGTSGCANGGEKCRYSLVSQSRYQINATHKNANTHYKDDLNFNFFQISYSCSIKGYSTSENPNLVLDNGTNYCNLYNLITGAGLELKESVSDPTCTQFSIADCSKY